MDKIRRLISAATENESTITGISVDGKTCQTKSYKNGRFVIDSKTDVLVIIAYNSKGERFLSSIDLPDKSGKSQAKVLHQGLIEAGVDPEDLMWIGGDGTASNTGPYGGMIRHLELVRNTEENVSDLGKLQ